MTNNAYGVVPGAGTFVAWLTLVFAFETILDPIATGPLLKRTALAGTVATDLVPFLFVYLGDFRVLLLVAGVARGLRNKLRGGAHADGNAPGHPRRATCGHGSCPE